MTAIWMLYSTFPNRNEALSAARTLVDARLAACVNVIDNVTSVYRWEGSAQQEAEVILIAKTHASVREKAIELLKASHPYTLPCILAYKAKDGLPSFLEWVENETALPS